MFLFANSVIYSDRRCTAGLVSVIKKIEFILRSFLCQVMFVRSTALLWKKFPRLHRFSLDLDKLYHKTQRAKVAKDFGTQSPNEGILNKEYHPRVKPTQMPWIILEEALQEDAARVSFNKEDHRNYFGDSLFVWHPGVRYSPVRASHRWKVLQGKRSRRRSCYLYCPWTSTRQRGASRSPPDQDLCGVRVGQSRIPSKKSSERKNACNLKVCWRLTQMFR